MPIDRKRIWKKVPGIIRHDFVRKFLSVLLALIVYIAVSDKMGVERDIQNVVVKIPGSLVLKHGPEPLTLIKIDGKTPHVKIRIRGSERLLKNLSDNDFSIDNPVFKPDSYTPGEPYQLLLTPKDVKGPAGVQILSVDPAVVPVDFDILLTKMVEVKAIFDTKKPADRLCGQQSDRLSAGSPRHGSEAGARQAGISSDKADSAGKHHPVL